MFNLICNVRLHRQDHFFEKENYERILFTKYRDSIILYVQCDLCDDESMKWTKSIQRNNIDFLQNKQLMMSKETRSF